MWRLVLGFLVAPLCACLFLAAYSGINGHTPTISSFGHELLAAAALAYPAAILFGVPLLVVFRFLKARSWFMFVVGAVFCAQLLALVLLSGHSDFARDPLTYLLLNPFIASAALAGMVFWVIAIRANASYLSSRHAL